MSSKIVIRDEQTCDCAQVRLLNELAFGRPEEADIVDRLRVRCKDLLSLVALVEDRVVGHVLFSPTAVESHEGRIRGMGLAPIAVLPEYQGQRIGSRLVDAGLEILRVRSCPFVIVLGHADYYPRFGFIPASRLGIRSQWKGIPDEAFMVCILDQSISGKVSGIARYRDEFDEAMESS
ncbi:MAG: N-acetyltransferase [Syntrophobacteraceae bacterium]|nr:N-acetyltransferase [Syntrophobacteraceae bacterium]